MLQLEKQQQIDKERAEAESKLAQERAAQNERADIRHLSLQRYVVDRMATRIAPTSQSDSAALTTSESVGAFIRSIGKAYEEIGHKAQDLGIDGPMLTKLTDADWRELGATTGLMLSTLKDRTARAKRDGRLEFAEY